MSKLRCVFVPLAVLLVIPCSAAAGWRPVGPFGGTVTVLAVDPFDSATVLAGTWYKGVYRSNDHGATWQRAIAGDVVGPVVFDPVRPGTVYAEVGLGIFKSRDHGRTWTSITGNLPFFESLATPALAPDPVRPAVYAIGIGGLFRSTAGGPWRRVSWIPGGGPSVLAFDPSAALYAATDSGLYRSTNRGASWQRLSLATSALTSLAISPANSSVFYAGGQYGLYRSTDRGAQWQPVHAGLPSHWVLAIAVHPARPGTVYAALRADAAGSTGGLYRSTDGGAHWAPLRVGAPAGDANAVAVAPGSPVEVYGGFPLHGVYRSADAGKHWSEANAGLAILDVTRVVADPERPGTVYAGPLLTGVVKSTDAGRSWRIVNDRLHGPWGASAVALDPADSSTVYAGMPGRLERSDDGGEHWQRLDVPGQGINGYGLFTVDPGQPATLFTAGEHVFKSANGGESWTQTQDLFAACGMTPYVLTIGPESAVYVSARIGDSTRCPFFHLGLFKSLDGGSTWTVLRDYVLRLAPDPHDAQVLYALDDRFRLLRSSDGGGSFSLVSTLPFSSTYTLAIDSSSRLYLGGSGFVITSGDGGATWDRVGGALGGAVLDLAADPGVPGRLWAGTDHGVWLYEPD